MNSGAVWYDKGDVSTGQCLISCKQTEGVGFRLTLSDLREVEEQAKKKGLIPVMCLEIRSKQYVVLRFDDAFPDGVEIRV